VLDLAAANWTTALGALCFLACAQHTLLTGHTFKSARRRHRRRLGRRPDTVRQHDRAR
jgi:hypothetical protein